MTDNETTPTASPEDSAAYTNAVEEGKRVLAEGKSKADAARAIFNLLPNEKRDVLVRAFVEGANLTEKGAPTYFYNITRQMRRAKPLGKEKKVADPKKPAKTTEPE